MEVLKVFRHYGLSEEVAVPEGMCVWEGRGGVRGVEVKRRWDGEKTKGCCT